MKSMKSMKKLIWFSALAPILMGCASTAPGYDETAFLNETPHEICSRAHVLSRYGSIGECKDDVTNRQAQVRQAISDRAQQTQKTADAFIQAGQYFQGLSQPASNNNGGTTTTCTTQENGGTFRTRCR